MTVLQTSETQTVRLNEDLLIGEGGSRRCYIHPLDANRCIKTIKEKSHQRSVNRETRYFKKLQKGGKSFKMISKYFGSVKTNQGMCEVYELVRDYDGEISKDLKYYLNLKDKAIYQQIIKQVEALREYLHKEDILFSDLCTHNILLKKVSPTEYKLIVIDGIGHNNQIPFHEYFHTIALKRLIKKWEKFRLELIEEFSCLQTDVKHFLDTQELEKDKK